MIHKMISAAALALAFSTQGFAQDLPPLPKLKPYTDAPETYRICTGSPGLPYHTVAGLLVPFMGGVEAELIPGGGTWGCLQKMAAGEVDAAVVQPDGPALVDRLGHPLGTVTSALGQLHTEYLVPLCHRDGLSNAADVEGSGGSIAIVGGPAGGTHVTWSFFGMEDKGYTETQKTFHGSLQLAAAQVASKQAQCLISAQGLWGDTIAQVDDQYGDQLRLVDMTDMDFDDAQGPAGNRLYEFATIELAELDAVDDLSADAGGWDGKIRIPSWRALLVARTDFPETETLNQVAAAVAQARAIDFDQIARGN